MRQANVIGWYDHGNIGDESYKQAFPTLFPDVTFHFSDVAPTEPCDNCILGGGDVLCQCFVQNLLDSPARKRIILSVSVNPATAPFELLKRVDQIIVRDLRSVEILRSHDIKCVWMPDIATILSPNRELGELWLEREFREHGLELYERRIGVVFNSHLYHHDNGLYARDLITLLKACGELAQFADSTSASFIFFPMSTQMPCDDRITNGFIAGQCKFWRKNLLVYDALSVQDTLNDSGM